jgi:serine/threonine protein phosphatase PrpC
MFARAGVASNVGLVRQTNEDSYLVHRGLSGSGLYAVCDGMGGARAGEIASEMACRGLTQIDLAAVDGQSLVAAVKDINRAIADRSLEEPALFGMGTTLTAAAAVGDRLLVVQVGDSRAYLLHQGALRQITQDHSWVGEMVRRGELTPAEAAVHPHRSVITRALGTESEVEPDLIEIEVEAGDRLLLCSDGLSGMVPDVLIEEEMSASAKPVEIAERLVRAALAAGGDDNVTAIVVEFQEGEECSELSTGSADEEVLLGPLDRGETLAARASTVGTPRNVRSNARGRLVGRLSHHAQRLVARGATDLATTEASGVGPDGPEAPEDDALHGAALVAEAAKESDAEAVAPERQPTFSSDTYGKLGKGSRHRRLIAAVVIVVVLVVAIASFAVFNSTVYYLGVHEGMVALFNGLPASILGLELSSMIEQGTVAYDSLPSYIQARIDAHELTGKEEGQRYLRSLGAVQ